jgi:hypothetical protein
MEMDDANGGFALEVTRFSPTLSTGASPVISLAEFDSIISRCAEEREVVVGLICDKGAGGAFYLFVNGNRAWIHLTQGPCYTAVGQAVSEPAEVVFRLDTGETRAVPIGRTVSRQEGLNALRHWFATEQQWSELEWVRV